MRAMMVRRRTMIGEPESAHLIEDNIVGCDETFALACIVDYFDFAARDVHTLNPTANMCWWGVPGNQEPLAFSKFKIPAIVADIERAIRSDGQAIWAAARLCNRLHFPVWFYACDPSRGDFD